VRVVNFVAKGTIEEGMLSVLKFKKSLFAGVLDGGDKDVFMGGSRLNKFMETVEAATAAIPEAMLEDAEEALRTPMETETEPTREERKRPARGKRPAAAPPERELVAAAIGSAPEPDEEVATAPLGAPAAADPWTSLLQAGMALLQQVVGAPRNGSSGGQPSAARPAALGQSLLKRDEQTGETYLKVPVPSAEVLDQALRAVSVLLEGLRK
jgi:hypothetical protein